MPTKLLSFEIVDWGCIRYEEIRLKNYYLLIVFGSQIQLLI
jgi:hypothetical protein